MPRNKWLRFALFGGLVLLVASLAAPRLLAFTGIRAFVFADCLSPELMVVTGTEVNPYLVAVSGQTVSSALFYDGYVYRINGDVMYLGLRYTPWMNEAGGGFNVRISLPDQRLSKIYITDGVRSRQIYP